MENASKALIIAGAILISILIIAIGMYVFTSAKNPIITGTDLVDKQGIEAFNNTWSTYEGILTGAQVKGLVNDLIANYKIYKDEQNKLPAFTFAPKGSTETKILSTAGADYVGKSDGDESTGLNSIYGKIKAKASYKVELGFSSETSLVNQITVKEQ